MPIVGVLCGMDGTPQSFETCISCHENRSTERNCNAPVFTLKAARDNHIHRRGAGISASTLTSCPRAIAIEAEYDLYEPVISTYNKARGSWVHAMIEADPDPPEWVVREQRLYLDIGGARLSGQPDEVDTKYHVLVDYKSKDNIPRKPDPYHEFQFNTYAFLLRNGYWSKSDPESPYPIVQGEKANIEIDVIAAHYLTWKTKQEKAWLKMAYPVWDDEYTRELIESRMAPITQWREDGLLPECSPYVSSPYWKCDCEKWENQLNERGIYL